MPLFSFAKLTQHSGSFALSTKSARVKGSSETQAYIQFYSHLNDSLMRIASNHSKLFGVILGVILKAFDSRIKVGLVYFSSKISPKIVLTLSEDGEDICMISKEGSFSFLRKFKKSFSMFFPFFRLKLFPLLFVSKWGKTGSSYHLGSCAEIDISENGFIEHYSRVQIIGSLALRDIEVGPITATLLAQTNSAIESYLNESVLSDDN
jgi:hypothetical protein